MNSMIERLLTLRVADVMSKEVVQVASHDTMDHAARTFMEHSISGAPVVDEHLRCAGVLSAMDFVKKHNCNCAQNRTGHLLVQERSQPLRIDDCGEPLVCHYMTPSVQTIAAEQSLLAAARIMCAEHIHRLPVLDDCSRPVGMITALDVVAALVNAVEE